MVQRHTRNIRRRFGDNILTGLMTQTEVSKHWIVQCFMSPPTQYRL